VYLACAPFPAINFVKHYIVRKLNPLVMFAQKFRTVDEVVSELELFYKGWSI